MSQLSLVKIFLHELLDVPVSALKERLHQVLALLLHLLGGGLQQGQQRVRPDLHTIKY